jgi:hypothetical protein
MVVPREAVAGGGVEEGTTVRLVEVTFTRLHSIIITQVDTTALLQ